MSAFGGNFVFASDVGPGWVDYAASLALTATTTNPTKGNSTYEAYYWAPTNADIVIYRGRIVIGSTFSAGSGLYRISLPVTAAAVSVGNDPDILWVLDNGTNIRVGATNILTSTTLEMHLDSAGGGLSNTGPAGAGWATGDEIRWKILYQPA